MNHNVKETDKIKSFVISDIESTNEKGGKQSEKDNRNSLTKVPEK